MISFNSILYWLDRLAKGDARPRRVLIGWIALMVIALIGFGLARLFK